MRAEITRRGLLIGLGALVAGCTGVTELRQGVHFFVVNNRLMVRGDVIGRTRAAFADVLDQNPQVTTIVLQDMRGPHDVAAAQRIGSDIRARGLNTALQSDSAVYGGAVDLFLGGAVRSMVSGAQIGLRASDEAQNRRAYAEAMLGGAEFYEFALRRSPSDGIYILTEDEIMQHGMMTLPVQRNE